MTSDESLVTVARLVREFHDLTAGTPLAEDQEVVCHNDLSPKNTVYRLCRGELRPAAFIDWDLAAPGARIHDIAHVCWQYLGLGPGVTDVGEAARRMRLIVDRYGLPDRRRLVSTILWWQDRCRRGIEAQADAGDVAMARLRDAGVVREVQMAWQWVCDHQDVLERSVR
ncbi:phosphotransferase [Streptomyces sp. AC627_RSS907]|uniref:phosphotransferase n=1 Tax=Streptomyces sp. AC627_RSS907 TaxID=2823684 RepID=UPI0027E441D4|nr:phosphotransferase [Streptomyces sp. AC627_RSS907]